MKSMILCCLIGAVAYGADVTIELQQPPTNGTVAILLFDSPETFSQLSDPVRSIRIPASGQGRFTLPDVEPGAYALMVHYDENDNEQLDKNFIGIPREPVGFANGYSPKGPPVCLTLDGTNSATESVELRRPLGERGRIGAGVGALFRSSPYRDADAGSFMPIPAITYTGNRLQIFGPRAQFGLLNKEPVRLAAVAQYRAAAYEEDDSDYLEGMGDRDATMMAGLSTKVDLPAGFDISLEGRHDALDQIGGSEASLFLLRVFQAGSVRLTPKAGVNWMSDVF
ncbi:MAG: DUF2141 domain-containing protein, partial [Kiritimatiellaceae bacterium]|nr:DUF2141 domain-containing protein [Kiritimatiellaceae bacterium]